MANYIGFGQSENNYIGFGQSNNNYIGFGQIYQSTWSGETVINSNNK